MRRRLAIAVCLVAVSATAAVTAEGSASAATQPVRWQFAPDFRAHPNRNPFSSYLGGPAVWSLRQSQSLRHDGNYKLLPSFSSSFGSPSIKAWHGTTPNCVSLPAVGVNTGTKSASLCRAKVPGKAAFARPAPARMAIVRWTSPFDGHVTISHNAVADVDGTCGDGVTYYVDIGTTTLSNTRVVNKNALTLAPRTLPIHKGQSLNFLVDPGANGNTGCDTTQLQITIDRV